jgi:hypothetical protein
MPDPRQYVRPGQRLQIAASQINALNDMMRVKTGFTAPQASHVEPAPNVVLVKNLSGVDVPVMGVIRLSGVAVSPVGGKMSDAAGDSEQQKSLNSQARSFFATPVVVGATPLAGSDFAVALEPIRNGGVGRCAVGGVFACRVHVINESHGYASPRNGDQTRLASANCGRLKILWKEPGLSGANDAFGKWAIGAM